MSDQSPKRIRKAAPKWTKEELETLKRLYSVEKLPMKEISRIMGRSIAGVSIKANRTIPESNPSSSVDPQIISKVIDGYHRNDTLAKVGEDAGIDQKTIRLILSRVGLKKRKKYDVAPKFPKELVEEIRRLYVEEKMGQTEIANKLNIEQKVVRTVVVYRGFQTRPENWTDENCNRLLEMLKSERSLWDIACEFSKTDLQVIRCAKFMEVFDKYPILHKRLSSEQQERILFIYTKIFAIKNYDKKKFGIDSALTISDIFKIYKQQNGRCFYTDEELQLMTACENTLSVERIDSSKPHSLDNIVLATWESNQMKQDMSIEKFLSVAQKISSRSGAIKEALKEQFRPNQRVGVEHLHP